MDSLFKRYIEAANLIYKNGYFDITDKGNNMVFLSDKLAKILGIEDTSKPINVRDINCGFIDAIDTIIEQNQHVISTKIPIKFTSMGKFYNEEYLISRGAKYPIVAKDGEAIGVFTIVSPAKVTTFGSSNLLVNYASNRNYITFEIDTEHALSDIEQQILFYSSIGFTQGEVYEFIKSSYSGTMPLNTFKSYQFKLLKKFNMPDIESLIQAIDELKNRRFIPKNLIKNDIIHAKS